MMINKELPSSKPLPPSCNLSTCCAFVANLFVLDRLIYVYIIDYNDYNMIMVAKPDMEDPIL